MRFTLALAAALLATPLAASAAPLAATSANAGISLARETGEGARRENRQQDRRQDRRTTAIEQGADGAGVMLVREGGVRRNRGVRGI